MASNLSPAGQFTNMSNIRTNLNGTSLNGTTDAPTTSSRVSDDGSVSSGSSGSSGGDGGKAARRQGIVWKAIDDSQEWVLKKGESDLNLGDKEWEDVHAWATKIYYGWKIMLKKDPVQAMQVLFAWKQIPNDPIQSIAMLTVMKLGHHHYNELNEIEEEDKDATTKAAIRLYERRVYEWMRDELRDEHKPLSHGEQLRRHEAIRVYKRREYERMRDEHKPLSHGEQLRRHEELICLLFEKVEALKLEMFLRDQTEPQGAAEEPSMEMENVPKLGLERLTFDEFSADGGSVGGASADDLLAEEPKSKPNDATTKEPVPKEPQESLPPAGDASTAAKREAEGEQGSDSTKTVLSPSSKLACWGAMSGLKK